MVGKVLDYEAKRILNKGIEAGIERANIANAQKMLLGNMEVSLIMEITELSKEKVEGLKQELIENGNCFF